MSDRAHRHDSTDLGPATTSLQRFGSRAPLYIFTEPGSNVNVSQLEGGGSFWNREPLHTSEPSHEENTHVGHGSPVNNTSQLRLGYLSLIQLEPLSGRSSSHLAGIPSP